MKVILIQLLAALTFLMGNVALADIAKQLNDGVALQDILTQALERGKTAEEILFEVSAHKPEQLANAVSLLAANGYSGAAARRVLVTDSPQFERGDIKGEETIEAVAKRFFLNKDRLRIEALKKGEMTYDLDVVRSDLQAYLPGLGVDVTETEVQEYVEYLRSLDEEAVVTITLVRDVQQIRAYKKANLVLKAAEKLGLETVPVRFRYLDVRDRDGFTDDLTATAIALGADPTAVSNATAAGVITAPVVDSPPGSIPPAVTPSPGSGGGDQASPS